jgi:hypothetical protein
VAVEIARRTGVQIGETVADRYEAARTDPPKVNDKRRLIASNLADLSATLSEIARGRADRATLHNVEVHVRQTVELIGRTSDVKMRAEM